MDLEYWKQRAIEAEQALKDAGGSAVDTVRRGVDMGKAKMGFDNNEPLGPQLTDKAGSAITKAGEATKGAAGDLEALFLDSVMGGPSLTRPQPGQSAEPPAPGLTRPQPGQRAEPPGNMERALKAAEEAFNSVMQGAGGAVDAVGDAVAAPFEGMGQGFNEGLHTGMMNKTLEGAGLPPVPFRDPEDPYYGRQYPHLTRPQPGQDWEPPGQGPVRGEELGWPFYMPQVGPNGRPKAPLPPEMGGSGNPIRRT